MSILILGASCIDIIGQSDKRIISYESNPGIVKILQSGSARNTAEYLSRIGILSNLVTAVGQDVFGQNLLTGLAQLGIDISQSLILKSVSTSTNMYLTDADGELFAGVKSDNISYMLDIGYLRNVIKNSPNILMADDTLNIETILYISGNVKADLKIFQPLNLKINPDIISVINKFDVIKLNKSQAETLWGGLISSSDDAKRCARYLSDSKKIKKVFITLDDLGSVGADINGTVHIPAYKTERSNKTEAESAFSAGMIFSLANDFSLYRSVLFSQSCYSYANNLLPGSRDKFSLEEVWNMLLRGDKIILQSEEY
ncbi:MAG: PfkB family carbohydrate kinase [Eubacteriaceae bacterium]